MILAQLKEHVTESQYESLTYIMTFGSKCKVVEHRSKIYAITDMLKVNSCSWGTVKNSVSIR